MIEVCVTTDEGLCHCMFVFIPTRNEILRKLSLRKEWNYIMVGKNKKDKVAFTIYNDTIVENGTHIRLYKTSVEPICDFPRLPDIVERLKQHYENNHNTGQFLIWINYDFFYNPREPIYLVLISKKNGKWKECVKTTGSFKELEDAITSQDVFQTLYPVYDRFEELREYYNWN